MRFLFLGDVVGRSGRKAVLEALRRAGEELEDRLEGVYEKAAA